MSAADLRVASLIERHLDGSLDPAGRAELSSLVRESPEAMRLLADQLDLSTVLAEHFSGEDFAATTVDRILAARAGRVAADPERVASARHRRSPSLRGDRGRPPRGTRSVVPTVFRRVALAAAAVIAVVVGIVVVGRGGEAGHPAVVATVSEADGTVARGGREVPLTGGTALYAGDVVHVGDFGHVDVAYADGTRLRLSSRTIATFAPESAPENAPDVGRNSPAGSVPASAAPGKLVRIHEGEIGAQVAKQPPGAPMVIRSADAVATVVGTTLTFATASDGSRLDVSTGKVRLTRLADRASIDVGEGEFGVVAPGADLVAMAIAPAVVPAHPPAEAPVKPLDARKRVLLLQQHPGDDPLVAARLAALGYEVVTASDAAANAADARGFALVVIPESVMARNVGARFREVEVPVLCWECGLWPDLGVSRAGTMVPKSTSIVITAPGHPLAAGFTGTVTVSTAPVDASAMRSAHDHPGRIVATVGKGRRDAALFAFEAGDEMDQDFRAPARRAGFFLHGHAESSLTPAGWAMFDATVRWCVGDPQPDHG